jgi:complement component 1 Q subcomponent-binding protein
MFTISNISYYGDEKLATDMSSEGDWKRQGLYMGPAVSRKTGYSANLTCLGHFTDLVATRAQFENLDDGVQGEFETFLEERGINSSLALFIPDLAEYK